MSIADEVPFDIPDSWEWVRFGNIVANYDSKRRPVTKEQRKTEYGYYDYYGATGAIDKVDDYLFEGVYLMIGEDGGNFFTDRDNSFIASGKFWANNHVHIVQPIICDIWYLKHFLDSCNLPNMGLINGIAVPKLNQEHLNSILVPLPPINEQIRIITEIGRFIPLVEEYERATVSLNTLNKDFPSQLKKSILQMAVQGKLVPQDENDEPASVLLEHIRAEKEKLIAAGKIKRDKSESVIFRRDNSHYEKRGKEAICIDDLLPFEIPESWSWCYLGALAFVTKLAGFEYTKYIADNLKPFGIPLFKGKNVQNGQLVLSFESYIEESLSDELYRSQISRKCLLTPYVGTIGNIAIFDGSFKAHLGSNVGKIEICNPKDSPQVMEEYVLYYLRSSAGYDELTKYKKATAQESISIEAIRNVLIPIPPLNEQIRIIKHIENLFAMVETL